MVTGCAAFMSKAPTVSCQRVGRELRNICGASSGSHSGSIATSSCIDSRCAHLSSERILMQPALPQMPQRASANSLRYNSCH